VAFPTETVYGLGADALDENAVKKIFEAKKAVGQSSDCSYSGKRGRLWTCRECSPKAQILMDRFWPGPLTLVLEKSDKIPSVITAGLSTVGLRGRHIP